MWSLKSGNMNLKVVRKPSSAKATIGQLFIDSVPECYTLEDKVREIPGVPVSTWKIANETAIPFGTYQVILDYSERFKRIMPLINSVPGFSGVRIHFGNTDKDTSGCTLVGRIVRDDTTVLESVKAYNALFSKLEKANKKEKIFITYTKEEPVIIPVIPTPVENKYIAPVVSPYKSFLSILKSFLKRTA